MMRLENGHKLIAYSAGKMNKNHPAVLRPPVRQGDSKFSELHDEAAQGYNEGMTGAGNK
jgi:hypothetical protein